MTRDEVIRMAREVELPFGFTGIPALERFARLVAAYEREECAKVCEEEAAEWQARDGQYSAKWCARAIRAKGSE